jgi:hypothetical protein
MLSALRANAAQFLPNPGDRWRLPLGIVQVAIPTYGNLWSAAVTHRLRLEISNLDSPSIRPSTVPSVTAISNVRLELPVR